MDDGIAFSLRVRSEEDRCPEDALERRHESPVLRPALLHPECIQHLGRAAERDPRGLLPNRERRQKDRYESVLSPWQSIGRVSGYLKQKMAISPFMEEMSRWRTLYRESTSTKGREENPRFWLAFPLLPDHLYRVGLPEFPF